MLERGFDVRASGGKMVTTDPALKPTKLVDRRGKFSFHRRERSTAGATTFDAVASLIEDGQRILELRYRARVRHSRKFVA
jgi:hypothetical protein